jgi:16S rRNA processing protein RimM
MAEPTASDDRPVILGRIVAAHGIRGEVVLQSFTAEPQAIASYGPLDVVGSRRRVVIEALRPAKAGFIARLDGIGDRNAAEALKGAELAVARARLPAAAADEVYHADLIGLAVRLKGGATIGRVRGVENYGAGDLLAVRLEPSGREVLLPFSRASVPEIDLAGGALVVDPPQGLLES